MTSAERLEVRREAVRSLARERGLDGVIVYSWRRQAVSWLTGYHPGYLSNWAALWMPVDGDPVLGVRFPFDVARAKACGCDAVAVERPDQVVPPRAGRIGVIGGDTAITELPADFLTSLSIGREITDLIPEVADLRATCSREDIDDLRAAARLAGEALSVVSSMDLVEMSDFEIAGAMEGRARALGAVRSLALVGIGDGAVITEPRGRRVLDSDPVGVELTLFARGMCMHVNSTWPSRKPRAVDMRAADACQRARGAIINALRPGAAVDEVVAAGDDVLRDLGLIDDKEYDFGHGIGPDTPEVPQLVIGTGRHIKQNTVLAVHVGVRRPRGETAMFGGPVLVTARGAEELIPGDPATAASWLPTSSNPLQTTQIFTSLEGDSR